MKTNLNKTKHNGWVEINLDNLSYNIKSIKNKVGPYVNIMPIIKANSYGHGAVQIARSLVSEGIEFLGVASWEEGKHLRDAGLKNRIFLTNAVSPEQIEEIVTLELTPFVYTNEVIETINTTAEKTGKIFPVHIKIDTGMGRLGLAPENFQDMLNFIKQFENINIEGILTHFSVAEKDDEFTAKQLNIFNDTLKIADANGITFDYVHTANSAALIKHPQTHFNLIRPGLSIYGLYPSPDLKKLIDLKPVMEVKSKIAFIKQVPEGASISYGRTFITKRPSIIATIPVGYADGFPRLLSNSADILLNGKRAPVVGTVCMDSFMIDITDLPEAKTGDIVTLMGNEISADEWADKTKTINYEIVTNIGKRLPRYYIKESEVKAIEYI